MDRLAAMETFICAVETGSFSAAAKRLGVGQPAVSKSIASLEEALGTRLLLRTTRGLTPTEAGQTYYEAARRTVDQANEADAAVQGAGAGFSGRLRVSAAVTFASLHVVPYLGPLLKQHPQLNIEVVLDDRSVDLVEEGIDVSLRMGALEDSSMTARKIAEGRRRIIATPAYFESHGVPKHPRDLVSHQGVIYNRSGGGDTWAMCKGDEVLSASVAGRLRVSAAEGVRAAVKANLGLVMASEWMFAPELASGEVVTVLDDWTLPSIDLWAVFPAGRMTSVKARAFVDYVAALLAH
ncbi:LysR family transcriptional regulator [Pseudomonas sp. SLFW]|uniref:LysR family transcriptional regulator n=1 Tax=Pseudomonas sp. SLFW TaxID=2683259 RepID=UPI0014129FED|nr:LysR family transcriptional regulator [Pseudomonas sp. SLFW]NBB12565.1 LysR family transcriptional regulator [Pseudomonas sp. SLFW]